MNKKTKTIVLIVVAILVWGYSALEWVEYYQASEDLTVIETFVAKPQVNSLKLKPKEKLKLKLDYRDPFLNNSKRSTSAMQYSLNQNRVSFNTKKVNEKEPVEVKISWPNIVFSGVVNNKLGLLKIDSKDFIVKEGEIKEGVKINSISKDIIKVEFQGEIKEFKNN